MTAAKLEVDIQRELIKFLRDRDWHVERMSADAYQNGIPDLFCFHAKWGMRWIEIKRPSAYTFTLRQKQRFPAWERAKIGIWILTAASQEEYDKLFAPPNWREFWKPTFAIPTIADVDAMLDELSDEGGKQEQASAEQSA